MIPLARPVAFPLHPIVDGACGCGRSDCKRVGKHAAVLWKDLEYGSAVPAPAPGAGVGLKTGAYPKGSGIFVVDIDSEAALDAWEALDQGRSPPTTIVETGRGWQIWYEHPGFHVKNSAGDLGKGLDIRGDGGIVVAPGSPHANGKTYTIIDDSPPAPAPAWLLEWLRARPAPSEVAQYGGDVSGEERARRRDLYAKYLRDDAPARGPDRRGQGDKILFDVVQRGAYDLALPVEDVLELVRDHYDPRCSPMWGEELEERVLHKARDAKENSTRPANPPLPSDLAHLAPGVDPPIGEMFADIIDGDPPESEEGEPAPAHLEPDEAEKELGVVWGGWDVEPTPPEYLVQDLIPVATVGIFVAKGSSLKTWTALSIGADIANGVPWLGAYSTRKAPVLIVDFESGRWQLQNRMRLLRRTNCPDLAHANFPPQRIDTVDFWRNLARIAQRRKLGLVIIDSFAAGASGVDENDAAAAMPLHYASEFSEKLQCAVLFIHHAKKGDGGDERDVARGSGAIYAGCDWMYMFSPANEDRTKMIVHCNKPWGERPKDFQVALTVDGLVLDAEVDAEQQQRSREIEALVRSVLARESVASKQLLHKRMGRKSGSCSAEIDAMVARREIVILPGKGYTLDWPEARKGRVAAACRIPGTSTPDKLATAAHVDVDEINTLLTEGTLVRTATGFMPTRHPL